LLPEDVGEHVGVNHMQKVSRKGGNGNHSSQLPRGSYAVIAIADVATLFEDVGESCFLSKKVAKRCNRLEDC
jgi:hypothetical protein